jgi:IMP cyclohydrolase
MCGVTALRTALAGRPYPGRGCLAVRSSDGDLLLSYFLTGRSEASRARSFRSRANGDLEVVGTDAKHDALRHYIASASRGKWVVVGNGDHVVPVAERLAEDGDVLRAWAQHTYEPDPPIFTPRVWMAWRPEHPLVFGQARRSERSDGGADRVVWVFDEVPPGAGVLLTTYTGTVDHVSTSREPIDVEIPVTTTAELNEEVWRSLNPEVRVGCFSLDPSRPPSALIRSD